MPEYNEHKFIPRPPHIVALAVLAAMFMCGSAVAERYGIIRVKMVFDWFCIFTAAMAIGWFGMISVLTVTETDHRRKIETQDTERYNLTEARKMFDTLRQILPARAALQAIDKMMPDLGMGEIDIPTEQVSTHSNESFIHEPAITRAERAVLKQAAQELNGRFSKRTRPAQISEIRWTAIRAELLRESANNVSYATENPDRSISLTDAGWKWLQIERTKE
jgi:hypothetical protein